MYWWRRLFHKEQTERQLDAELAFDLEQRTGDYIKRGISANEAARRARIDFGGVEATKQQCRESRRAHVTETLAQDLRYGLRMMRRSPAFTAVVVLTLALGIGANTAMFSIVNTVLLSPLPYPHPEQLVTLHESKQNFQYGSISYPNFLDWQKENRTFSAMTVIRNSGFSLTGTGEGEQVSGLFISSSFFEMLGVAPTLGRDLRPGDDVIGAPPVVLLDAALWQRKFGAAQDVIGRAITLDARNYTVIGVMPASARIGRSFGKTDVYVPIGQWTNPLLTNRRAGLGIHGIGRLKPGVSIDQAHADLDRIARNLAAAYPDDNKGIGASMIPIREQVVGKIQPFLILLLAAVGFVLLIACVNVANLLLARSTTRNSEFAIRTALGAARGRLLRQLLTESILMAAAGGALGLALGVWTVRALIHTVADILPRVSGASLDARVLIFTTVVSLLAGLLFGLAPSFKSSRASLVTRIKDGTSSSGRTRYRAQNAFVIAELCMALVLLNGAGLMIRSLVRLWQVDPGFDSHHVLTFGLSLPPALVHAQPDAVRAAFRQVKTQIAQSPEVEATCFSWGAFPMQGDDEALFWMEGQPKPSSPDDMNWTLRYVVGPDYLKAMRITLLRGRFLTMNDDERSPHVAVVDEAFAAKFFPHQDAIGKRINIDDGNGESQPTEIVGLVRHVKQWGLDTDDQQALKAQLYFPFMQLPNPAMMLGASGTGVVVRSRGNTDVAFESVRRLLRQTSADLVAYGYSSLDQDVANTLATRRYSMALLGGFAGLALLLASVGIYGVISYVVGQRTREIGVRMALGAKQSDVLGLILGRASRLILAGLIAGTLVSLAVTQLMTTLLFGVSPTDALTFTCVALLLTIVALLACAVPARRATHVDPMIALRYE